VLELTEGHPERIKTCASDTCDWIFYDASRTSRRRWCDMATCGNRAKAARHRAKERAVQADPAGEAQPPAPA
jgi:predicted RNA-binding Zn ribbon-like protein